MRHVAIGVCLLALTGQPASAQDPINQAHVRAESADMRLLMADAAARSATFRALVDAIDGSDVIVYVRSLVLPSPLLEGRTGFLGVAAGHRFLGIELACARPLDAQMATLAHELRHVVEIARAPWVVTPATLRVYYEGIGVDGGGGAGRQFETRAARQVGEQVRHELASPPATLR